MSSKNHDFFSKEVEIPPALRELHGDRTRVSTLAAVYLAGLAAAGLAAVQLAHAGLPPWKVLLAALIFLDIGGGVAANFSASTRRYYRQHARLRLPFISLHVFHPAVMMALFPDALPYFLFVMVFTLGGTFAVNAVKDRELQKNLAALLVVVGVTCAFFFIVPAVVLYAFAPLFMIKLILGFAVNQPAAGENGS